MKKMLMIASVASMIQQFNMDNIKILQEMGYEVHVACNFYLGNTCSDQELIRFRKELERKNIRYYQVDFSRDIKNIKNVIKAYRQMIQLLEQNNYTFIHCHSPIGGVIGRIAAHRMQTKVIYTAHGFHFYKGAPLKNWLLYYPVEKWLSRFTDVLITINREDYIRAKKFYAKKVKYIPGVGIDTNKFRKDDLLRKKMRNKFHISKDTIVLLSVGELSDRKNHKIIIKVLRNLDIKFIYAICGDGNKRLSLKKLVKKYELEQKVVFLGYRKRVDFIYQMSDIFIFPSKQEGLPVSLMEAMAVGLPIICSDIRGNNDLIHEKINGYLVKGNHVNEYVKNIQKLNEYESIRKRMSINNVKDIKKYDISKVKKNMKYIYINI